MIKSMEVRSAETGELLGWFISDFFSGRSFEFSYRDREIDGRPVKRVQLPWGASTDSSLGVPGFNISCPANKVDLLPKAAGFIRAPGSIAHASDNAAGAVVDAAKELREHAWLHRFRKAEPKNNFNELSHCAANQIAAYVDKLIDAALQLEVSIEEPK